MIISILTLHSQLHYLAIGCNNNNENIMFKILITKYRSQHQARPKNRIRCCGLVTCGAEEGPLTYLEVLSDIRISVLKKDKTFNNWQL
jgi:hypothetical protein